MDHLWTPWRYQYVTRSAPAGRKGVSEALAAYPEDKNCVFCNLIGAVQWAIEQGTSKVEAEKAGHILLQGVHCYVCLNAYPYSSGHLMVIPYQHLQSLAELPPVAATEMILLAQRAERALRATYHPDGLNFGMNLGEAAGAGVAEHIHLHGLPRWVGDNNFMSVLGETRILPEMLDESWRRLHAAMQL
jgi:ATP adenylyltransferase